jgi:hypothetical protein
VSQKGDWVNIIEDMVIVEHASCDRHCIFKVTESNNSFSGQHGAAHLNNARRPYPWHALSMFPTHCPTSPPCIALRYAEII